MLVFQRCKQTVEMKGDIIVVDANLPRQFVRQLLGVKQMDRRDNTEYPIVWDQVHTGLN